jgi:glycosyltransferase involved in cell wall biosynthesis
MVQAYGVPAERIVVIPNGINGDRFDGNIDVAAAKAALGLQGQLVLGFTGFVRDWHGLDKVIDLIAADPPDALRTLLVVGDGPVRADLEQQAARLGIAERVHFTGIVERDDVAKYVAAFDIALQPAVVAYASPLKLFEYLALGKAIVAPGQPNIREILSHEKNALLFDPAHPEQLAAAIQRLCVDPALRLQVAAGARAAIVEQKLTWKANAQRVVELFGKLGAGRA